MMHTKSKDLHHMEWLYNNNQYDNLVLYFMFTLILIKVILTLNFTLELLSINVTTQMNYTTWHVPIGPSQAVV